MSGVISTLRNKNILLTGFTGFLAKVFAALLLDRVEEMGTITLLVRSRREESASERVRHIVERSPALRPLRERHGDRLHAFLETRLVVVEGDAERPFLGIDPRILAALAPTLDAVVHCAGVTDFGPDPMLALRVNVKGAQHAADVAALTRGKRLLHVSTAFVAGEIDGEIAEHLRPGIAPNGTRFDADAEILALESACAAVDEREGGPKQPTARRGRVDVGTRRARALGWPNIYTYSKGLAEHTLGMREDIAVTIVRPAIVECARAFPFPGWNEGLNTSGPLVWLVSGFAWKVPMRGDHTFDVVPVDTIARGMTVALVEALRDRAQPVYHLASGDHHRFTFDRALDLTALKVRRGYSPTTVSAAARALLTHLDTTALDHGADESVLLPAAKNATRWLRDRLREFDPERHLPQRLAPAHRERIREAITDASLRMNKTSMLLKSIEQMWEAYQPFIHDFDYRFVTRNIRSVSASLSAEDRAAFGWDLESLDWRTYWMDIEIPGLDRWSLPLLRGQKVPEDPPFDLAGSIGAHEIPLALPRVTHELHALSAGDAE